MKVKIHFIPRFLSLLLLVSAVIVCNLPAIAQDGAELRDEKLPLPTEEQFQTATDLVAPWRSSGCHLNFKFNEPNCRQITHKEFLGADTLSLYDSDGSLWYRFSLTYDNPDYFLKNKKTGFLPFATPYAKYGDPNIVILRMVGESPHWYEVEVNEQTQETKYVLKSDPMWKKTTWSYWLYESNLLRVDHEKSQLRDKPDGKVVEETKDLAFIALKFLKADGDWAYVESGVDGKKSYGWIRWRKGRDILVGCIFNDNKVPESKADAEDKWLKLQQRK